jgi:uncharacterized protein
MNTQSPNTNPHNFPNAEPIQVQERIEVLDVIRGFALLGILMANMALFGSPSHYQEALGNQLVTGFWDAASTSFVHFLIQGKFYTIFSFLFGLGFALFYERAAARSAKPMRLFYRRLLILLLIGLTHAFFIWFGDILVTYALLGFLLPLFFHRKPKTIIKWAVGLFLSFALFLAFAVGALALAKLAAEGVLNESVQTLFTGFAQRIESSYHAYGQGTFSEIMAQRSSDTLFTYSQLFTSIFVVFPLFLLGLYAGKRKIFQNIETNLTFIKKIWIWGLVIGLSMSIVKFFLKSQMGGDLYSFAAITYPGFGFLGDTGLCLFIMTSVVLLYRNTVWIQRFKPFASMGRMALSNYLFQSIVCTTIFYSYGLGLYGKVGSAWGLVLAVALFTSQIIISRYWLKRYHYGPMEWVWRCLTYGKRFRIKLGHS